MALSPLQSRLVASLAASLLLLAIYLLLFSPQLASATEIPLRGDFDHGPNGLLDDEQTDVFEPAYQPNFPAFDRSIIGRAASGVNALGNNIVKSWNLNPGESVCYVFSTGSSRTQTTLIDTSTTATATGNGKRDLDSTTEETITQRNTASRKIYISANTCLQPTQTKNDTKERQPPQLRLAAGTSGDGCTKPWDQQPTNRRVEFKEGGAMLAFDAEGDIFISISAPNVSEGFDGVFNFEVAASIDSYFHSYNDNNQTAIDLRWVDSDARGAILSTAPLKNKTLDSLPYKLFVENTNLVFFDGLRRSVCGMKNQARSFTDDLVTTSVNTGDEDGPRQQFWFEGLNSSSSYQAVLVQIESDSTKQNAGKRQDGGNEDSSDPRNGKVGGGGIVYGQRNFNTSSDKSSCKVVAGLDFCSGVEWAIPGSSSLNGTELGQKYDDYAKSLYENFEKVMMQVPCEADNSSIYSLIHTCDECKQAYKDWLCTVTFPRCEDYSSSNNNALERNVYSPFFDGSMVDEEERKRLGQQRWHNLSRNNFIETEIKPGPYKEVLPCDEVCFEVVRRCPAVIGFSCPKSNYPGFPGSYAMKDLNVKDHLTCNDIGTSRGETTDDAQLLQPGVLGIFSISLAVTLVLNL